jgi:hypothetical protein
VLALSLFLSLSRTLSLSPLLRERQCAEREAVAECAEREIE